VAGQQGVRRDVGELSQRDRYGKSFRTAGDPAGAATPNTRRARRRKYLQSRPGCGREPRVWGDVVGGVLTAAGARAEFRRLQGWCRLAGVPPLGQLTRSQNVAYTSSVSSAIDGWKSPVLLVTETTIGTCSSRKPNRLVQLLRARRVSRPDRVSDTRTSRAAARALVYAFNRLEESSAAFSKAHRPVRRRADR